MLIFEQKPYNDINYSLAVGDSVVEILSEADGVVVEITDGRITICFADGWVFDYNHNLLLCNSDVITTESSRFSCGEYKHCMIMHDKIKTIRK